MKCRSILSLAALFLTLGIGDFVAQPQPAGAESEAGLEAPIINGGRRRGRRWRGGYRQQQDPQAKYQQQLAAKNLQNDQMEANRHARQLGNLKKKDIIHNYGSGKTTNP